MRRISLEKQSGSLICKTLKTSCMTLRTSSGLSRGPHVDSITAAYLRYFFNSSPTTVFQSLCLKEENKKKLRLRRSARTVITHGSAGNAKRKNNPLQTLRETPRELSAAKSFQSGGCSTRCVRGTPGRVQQASLRTSLQSIFSAGPNFFSAVTTELL